MADAFSKDRITPLFRDTACLSDKLGKKIKSKDLYATNNTIAHKVFPGGHLTIVGSNSPAQLASRPIKFLLIDEVDRFPASSGKEGDPVNLAIQRTKTFRDRKIILTSTPTTKGHSRIEKAFNESDQRYFYVPCPHCHKEQKLEFEQIKNTEDYKSAKYHCLYCQEPWTELERINSLKDGEWRAEKPINKIAGFHISELYSPWTAISSIVKKFNESKRGGAEQLKVWTNTCLGIPFTEELDKTPLKSLLSKREDFSLDRIPDEVLFLTVGGDTQDDRLELSVLGWGLKQECYVLAHIVVNGIPGQSETWQAVEKIITRDYYKKNGQSIKISASCFDSGGHYTMAVYQFATDQTRKGLRVYAIKGKEGTGPAFEYRAKNSKTHRAHRYYSVSAGTTKDTLFYRLKVQNVGENYIHFSHKLDENYFSQLTSEAPKWELVRGRPRKIWVAEKGTRQEASDCWRYGFAAIYADQGLSYDSLCRDYEAKVTNTEKNQEKIRKSSYLEKYKYT